MNGLLFLFNIFPVNSITLSENHPKVYPFFSQFESEAFLGIYLNQYVALALVFLGSILLFFVLNFIFAPLFRFILNKSQLTNVRKWRLKHYTLPSSMVLVSLAVWFTLPKVYLPTFYFDFLSTLTLLLLSFFATIWIYRMLDILTPIIIRKATQNAFNEDDTLVKLLKKTLKVLVVISGILVFLDVLHVPILPIITGLSIGGLAIALAAKDTIRNFFGSIMILIDKPFKVGDGIISGDLTGAVEEIGFRSSRIRTFRNSLISIPNGNLADMMIDNNGMRKFRRYSTHIGIKYDTPSYLIQTFVEGLRKIIDNHPNTVKNDYYVYLNEFGNSSLDIFFCLFFQVNTWADELSSRQDVMLDIIKWAEKLNVQFAFPTQTLHMETFPEHKANSTNYETKENTQTTMKNYFQ